jgi:D-alanyl-D-alanine carboxypeptidase
MPNRHVSLSAFVMWLAATVVALAVQVVPKVDRVDDLIKAEMKRQNIPGLALAVIKDGEIVKAEGYGLANIKRQLSARADTVFKIASVSKQFIATGVMLLVQEGRLGVDDPIGKHLEGIPASWKAITIRHLLTHTSGIVREAPGFDPGRMQSDADVIRSAYFVPLRFAPGEKYEYSNTGYFALAEVIRKVSGQPWAEYLSEKVFRPCGMNTTYPTNTKVALTNRAQGYVDNDNLREAGEWMAVRPSGAFLSTVLDMAKWDAVLYTNKVLTDSTRREMWTPVKLNDGSSYPYGYGWQLEPLQGRRTVHHGGGGPGARAKFARFVDDRLTIVVLTNLDDMDIDSVVSVVAESYLPTARSKGRSPRLSEQARPYGSRSGEAIPSVVRSAVRAHNQP